ncbi:MAG: aminotransferase class I/II-fold pyridoxal phosphate-dependent enzyme [Planctomycetota bacterium]|nr:aminotransferase class I/II-fold pyridoxal phosphate-dependent enzyme [Planctomycetota bacterium]
MTRLCEEHGGINLAQGFPDFPTPEPLREAAKAAIDAGHNQYSITWGAKSFRDALTAKVKRWTGIELDPEREVTVCCGATEAMISALMAVVEPGDEVVVFEPFYENYGPDAILSGARPVFVTLRPPEWTFDRDELARAFSPDRTKAIVINTPHNPTGKVFSREELSFIAELCIKYDALAVTDEIYEHIVYDGLEHVPIWTLPGMRERTITISGMSKTYAVTGWRIGWCLAPPEISGAIRKVHDFLTVGAPAPLQEASVTALRFPDEYYDALKRDYAERRETMLNILRETGFEAYTPRGAYYVMTEISPFLDAMGIGDCGAFCRRLVAEFGVALVPGTSFYRKRSGLGRTQARFCFAKKRETLEECGRRLRRLSDLTRAARGKARP